MANLSYKTYHNCYALPIRYFTSSEGLNYHGGGLCCNGVWIKESALFPNSLASYEFDAGSADRVNEDVVFIGCMSSVWGHAITDCIKHLWWLQSEEYKKNHSKKKLFYWGPSILSGNYLELIRLAGVNVDNLYYIDHEMLFKSIIVPDISFNYTEGWASKEYIDTIEFISSNVKPSVHAIDKLFLSERESRRTWGTKSIEKLARSAGYQVYYPGDHSLKEQISVIRSAKNVLSFESSIGHNTVFCSQKTKLIMLRKENYANKYQNIINASRGFECSTINASLSIMNDEHFPYAGPFFVYPNNSVYNAISQNNSYRNSHNANLFPWRSFKKYLQYNLYCNKRTLAHVLAVPKEKAECLSNEITLYKNWQQDRVGSLFKYIPLPKRIKEKAVTKIVKYKVRHLL